MKSTTAFLALMLLSASLAGTAEGAAHPTFHFFQYPGATRTSLLGVSNRNAAVGLYYDQSEVQHGFMVTKGGTFTTIDNPNGVGTTVLYGVNSNGTIVGRYGVSGSFQAFSYDNGVFQDIGPPNAGASAAYGINDLGQIAGDFLDTDGVLKGWVFDGTKYQTLLVPGSVVTHAQDVNVHGIVALQWVDAAFNAHSAIYNGTTYIAADVPGAVGSRVHALDSVANVADLDVVYEWSDAALKTHSALFSRRKFTKFDAPGCDNTSATGINDHHVIVGTCFSSPTKYQSFYVIY